MSKKMMLLALSVACAALFALPAVASAQSWHISQTGNFTVHGGVAELSTHNGNTIKCSSVTSTGTTNYTTTTTGNLRLLFHGCVEQTLGTSCTSAGQPSGTILTEQLTFHNVMLAANTPGILVTPGATRFAHFTCAFGFETIEVKGNGVLGHIEDRKCGETNSTANIKFEAIAHGTQRYTQWTNLTIGLTRNNEPAAQNATGTVTFPGARTITCT